MFALKLYCVSCSAITFPHSQFMCFGSQVRAVNDFQFYIATTDCDDDDDDTVW